MAVPIRSKINHFLFNTKELRIGNRKVSAINIYTVIRHPHKYIIFAGLG